MSRFLLNVSLASNIVTHFEVSPTTSTLTKVFSPLKIFELKGSKDSSTIIQLDKSQHIIHNQSEIVSWLQEAKGKTRIDAELFVRLSHKRK